MATLKIGDLSVGDWVRYDDRICQIAEIHQLSYNFGSKEICSFPQVTLYYEDDMPTYQESVPFKDIHPIPITAEILERNGFEFEKASRWHICELEDETRINVWIGKNNEGRIEVSKPAPFDDGYHFKYADIEVLNIAVHQLQHVLRLAGVDKEINL
jgi:hypothetical protein